MVFSTLQKYSNIIVKTKIVLYEFEENQVRIKIELELKDGTMLMVKDYKFGDNKRKYAYHWMDRDGVLKIRWDNAAHWKSVSTFPHHKHVEDIKNVQPSTETDIESVLDYILQCIKSPGKMGKIKYGKKKALFQ